MQEIYWHTKFQAVSICTKVSECSEFLLMAHQLIRSIGMFVFAELICHRKRFFCFVFVYTHMDLLQN